MSRLVSHSAQLRSAQKPENNFSLSSWTCLLCTGMCAVHYYDVSSFFLPLSPFSTHCANTFHFHLRKERAFLPSPAVTRDTFTFLFGLSFVFDGYFCKKKMRGKGSWLAETLLLLPFRCFLERRRKKSWGREEKLFFFSFPLEKIFPPH